MAALQAIQIRQHQFRFDGFRIAYRVYIAFNMGDVATIEEITAEVDAYNIGEDFEEGEGIRLKNVITGWYSIPEHEAEEGGYFFDEETQLTFVDENACDLFIIMRDSEDVDDAPF